MSRFYFSRSCVLFKLHSIGVFYKFSTERTAVRIAGACMCAKLPQSCLLFATPWTVARQDYLSIGFSRQEYWSGLPCPPPGDIPDPGIKLTSLISPAPEQKQMMSEWGIHTGGVRSLGNYNIGMGQLTELRD